MGMTLCTSATVSRTEHSDLLALVWQHPSVGTAGHVCLWTALCQSPESGMTIRGTLGTAVTGWGFWALAELSLSSSVDPIVLLLLLSCFSRVQLCATPQTAAHQGPPSLGFSRQEHWSGLPLPSPRHESEKWKWSRSVVSNSLATPWTTAHQAPPSMGFSRQECWSGVPPHARCLLFTVPYLQFQPKADLGSTAVHVY